MRQVLPLAIWGLPTPGRLPILNPVEQLQALQYVNEAVTLAPQARFFAELTLKSLSEEPPTPTAATQRPKNRALALQQVVAPFRKAVAGLFENIESSAWKQARLISSALELWDHRQRNDDLWRMAMVSLNQQLANLAIVRDGVQRVTVATLTPKEQNTMRKLLWPADIERRYEEVAEELDDLMETLALGLNDEMRSEIDAALEGTS